MTRYIALCKTLFVLLLLNLGLIVVYVLSGKYQTKDVGAKMAIKPITSPLPVTGIPLKKILYWNNFFSYPYFNFGSGRKPFVKAKCLQDHCSAAGRYEDEITNAEDFDAIIFHGYQIPSDQEFDIPKSRNPRQRYVFFLKESPEIMVSNLQNIPRGFFNWTMTYRLDSDIPSIYGTFKTLTKPAQYLQPPISNWKRMPNDFTSSHLSKDTKAIITKKNKMAAWFVSNCQTPGKRGEYVKDLQNYIQVDIYGRCGKLECPMSSERMCYTLLEEKYFFYLSFENSICRDYATEKFFNVMQYNVVPVVYGGANYSQRAPPGSYIDVKDFDSPRLLAEYLSHLASHPEEYARYFWWRSHYKAVGPTSSNHFCHLCEMLHERELPPKTYDSIRDWYVSPRICQKQQKYLKWSYFNKTDVTSMKKALSKNKKKPGKFSKT